MMEALTIVLVAGVARDWRSSLFGTERPFLRWRSWWQRSARRSPSCPSDALRLVVGALLLAFELQSLRKAILRASGFKALYDEGSRSSHKSG